MKVLGASRLASHRHVSSTLDGVASRHVRAAGGDGTRCSVKCIPLTASRRGAMLSVRFTAVPPTSGGGIAAASTAARIWRSSLRVSMSRNTAPSSSCAICSPRSSIELHTESFCRCPSICRSSASCRSRSCASMASRSLRWSCWRDICSSKHSAPTEERISLHWYCIVAMARSALCEKSCTMARFPLRVSMASSRLVFFSFTAN
mmetsp:Transcript_21457/g.45074  ORF Transcript_21457/g.45074 Transcript_21457/m.45074 type:complete len:204 (+) Transcript_21457:345-956(+)